MEPDNQTLERFMSKVKFFAPGECWEWTAHKSKDGYGSFRIKKQYLKAHRVSYEWAKGTIPKKMCVCHSCDNPSCVNPEHLWVGTQRENVLDMHAKKRSKASENCKIAQAKYIEKKRSIRFCPLKHEYTSENTYINKNGQRQCKKCFAIRARRYRAEKKLRGAL